MAMARAQGRATTAPAGMSRRERYTATLGGVVLDSMPQKEFLKTKFQVGSCKGDRVSFSSKDKVFHSGDIRKDVVEQRKIAQRSVKPDILGLARPAWSESTIADPKIEKAPRRNIRQELLAIRGGQVDQTLVTQRKQRSKEEVDGLLRYVCATTGKGPVGSLTKKWMNTVDERGLGAHCVEPSWPDWNCSANTKTAEDVKVKEKRFVEQENRRKAQNKPDALISEFYRNPTQQVGELEELLRQKKLQYVDLRDEFKNELQREFPQASDERIQAKAARLVDEKLMVDEKLRRYPIPHESFRPNLSLTTADRRYKEWSHPGKWERHPVEGLFSWSCCMNYTEHSKGCEYTTVNPDSWCYLTGGEGRV
jgi:hypothetical protein